MCQQLITGRIEINADPIDGSLNDGIQFNFQRRFRQIMLILTNANGLRTDLYQLGQWILETPANTDGTALFYRQLWKLVTRVLTG